VVAALARGLVVAGVVVTRWVPAALRTPAVWQPLALSVGAVAGHVAVLLTALAISAPDIGLVRALPLLLGVLVASSLPFNLAGWGPREGAAAGLFGLAGLGAQQGVTMAATYGVLSLAAALPGALLLLGDALPRRVAVHST
jgi:hypothetical protein